METVRETDVPSSEVLVKQCMPCLCVLIQQCILVVADQEGGITEADSMNCVHRQVSYIGNIRGEQVAILLLYCCIEMHQLIGKANP